MTREEFAKGMMILKTVLPLPENISDVHGRQIWYGLLKDISVADFNAAIEWMCKNTTSDDFRWHPVLPGDIRRVVNTRNGVDRNTAWEQVRALAHDWRATTCSHLNPVVQKAVASLGGLMRLKEMNWQENETWIRRDFLRAMDEVAETASKKPELLPGATQERIGRTQTLGGILEVMG